LILLATHAVGVQIYNERLLFMQVPESFEIRQCENVRGFHQTRIDYCPGSCQLYDFSQWIHNNYYR